MQALLHKKRYFKLKNALLFLSLLCLYYIFANAGIKQELFPFHIGLYIALIWCNKLNFLNLCFFSLNCFIINFNFNYFLSSFIFALALYSIFEFLKKKNKHISIVQYSVLNIFLLFIYFPYLSHIKTPILNIVYTFLLAIIFYLSICKCLKTVLTKGENVKLNLNEIVCVCFLLITIGAGLSQICISSIPLIKPIGIILIFLSCLVCENSAPLIVAASLGIGYTLNLSSLEYISIFSFFALISIIFKNNKYYLALSFCLIELLLGLYFKVYITYNILNFILSTTPIFILLIVPNKFLENLKLFFTGENFNLSSRNLIERHKKNLSKKLNNITNAFYEIQVNFKNTLKNNLPKSESSLLIRQELCKNVCLSCKNKEKCFGILKDSICAELDTIIETAFQKQKITILDLPSFISAHCSKCNLLITTTNNLIKNYNKFMQNQEEKNSGKLLFLESLDGLNKMVINLSREIQENVLYNFSLEELIISDLNFYNIYVKDVVLMILPNNKIELSLLTHEKYIENEFFLTTISKILKQKLEIVNIEKSQIDNFSLIHIENKAKYDCIYGISGSNKFGNTVSGDNFSCIKLKKDKILFAICDGMGNGDNAKFHSEHTINLIESFYKAGFADDNVIEIVNKLITLESEEFFSALDIALIDLNNGKTDFIKLGSQESFIKENDKLDIICGDSLPMGIIKEIKPSINSRIINFQNMVFMCSDGVIDCIGYEELCLFLQRTTIKNPQTLCDEIVNLAIKNTNGKPKDDITALAFKLFLN